MMTMKSDSSELPRLLKTIKSPDDLKKLNRTDLPLLAEEIREVLITRLSVTGGHLGPNLGVVELCIAMHYVFDSPDDKMTFDVSHQGYVHKMLTGRADEIHTIRTYEGLNGFLLRTESEHDCYGAGHAGTALSSALGMASARDLAGKDNHVIAFAGDAAFTCGATLEALNNINDTTKKFIIVLNDNEWSIDKNVGAISRYFNSLQTSPTYSSVRKKSADLLEKFGGAGIRKLAHKVEQGAKNLFSENILFENFGIRYYGPVKGHDVNSLIDTFEYLKEQDEPVILHAITEKGKGYTPALDNPGKFHGLGPYKQEDGSTAAASLPTFSEIFGRTVTDMAKKDEKITAITAAMPGGTKLDIFKKELNERYFDVGIAEEHAALFACGHACEGYKPFLAIYSTFMQRAYDMIIHDIALQNLPVRLCGATCIRFPRGAGVGAKPKAEPEILTIGEAELVADGSDICLIGLGHFFEIAVETKAKLEALGYSVALINPRWIKPLDAKLITEYAQKCKVVCTFEDHVLMNGFGASIIELLHTSGIHTPVERIGWPDEFVEHGKVDILRAKHGITVENAVSLVQKHL